MGFGATIKTCTGGLESDGSEGVLNPPAPILSCHARRPNRLSRLGVELGSPILLGYDAATTGNAAAPARVVELQPVASRTERSSDAATFCRMRPSGFALAFQNLLTIPT